MKQELNSPASEPILIGHLTSLTGEMSTFGQETDNGIALAVREWNAKGGVLKRKIQVLKDDDQSDTPQVDRIAEQMASESGVVGVIGPFTSTRAIRAAPHFQRAGIPFITSAATRPDITRVGKFIFRACFIDAAQGTYMARFAYQNQRSRRAGILLLAESDYSLLIAEAFRKEFTRLGGRLVGSVSYQEGEKRQELHPKLLALRTADALFIPGYYVDIPEIAITARKIKPQMALLGVDGWDSPDLLQDSSGTKALQGAFFLNHFAVDDPSPAVRTFQRAYKAQYAGNLAGGLSALGYDAANLLLTAIQQAGSTEGEKVRMALATLKGFSGVTGPIRFDRERNPIKPGVVLRITKDRFVYHRTIAP